MTEQVKFSTTRTPFHTSEGEAILQRVESHWQSLRQNNALPDRNDIAPVALEQALSHSFVLQRVAASMMRFRVAGQAIHDMMQMEPRGMPLSAMFTGESRVKLGPIVNAVCELPELAEVPLISARGFARKPIRGRLLLLPLRDHAARDARVFGAMVTDAPMGKRTLRWDIDPDVALRTLKPYTALSVVDVPKVQRMPETKPDPQFGSPVVIPTKEHGFLRLVVDNT